jgi:hypothetical protein
MRHSIPVKPREQQILKDHFLLKNWKTVLDASLHFYERLCPSIGPSFHRSVHSSVHQQFANINIQQKLMKIYENQVMRIECLNHRIMDTKRQLLVLSDCHNKLYKSFVNQQKKTKTNRPTTNKQAISYDYHLHYQYNGDNIYIYKYTEREVKRFEGSQIFFWYSTMNINVRMNTFNIVCKIKRCKFLYMISKGCYHGWIFPRSTSDDGFDFEFNYDSDIVSFV